MFEQSAALANNPKYLGNYRVVDGLVRDFVAAVMDAESEDDIVDASSRYADIFAGINKEYLQVFNWSNRGKLGAHLKKFMNVDGGQSFYDMVRTAFVVFAQQLMALVVGGGTESAQKKQLDDMVRRFVGILMGAGPMVAA